LRLYSGTSGFSYKEWKGKFYPEDLPASGMLHYYAQQLPAVEINNTFYRMPKREMLQNWCEQVPDTFRFSIKASQRITHKKRLKECEEECAYLFKNIAVLGDRLGVVLFQLPPYLRKDAERLKNFCSQLPDNSPISFEFRHYTWRDEEIYDILREHNFACCIADMDEGETTLISTADWGYLRLRRSVYTQKELQKWHKQIVAQPWQYAFVFFKHEDDCGGPELAAKFLGLQAA